MTTEKKSPPWRWIAVAGAAVGLALALGIGLPWVTAAEKAVDDHDHEELAHQEMRVKERSLIEDRGNEVHEALLDRIKGGEKVRDERDRELSEELKAQRKEILRLLRVRHRNGDDQ